MLLQGNCFVEYEVGARQQGREWVHGAIVLNIVVVAPVQPHHGREEDGGNVDMAGHQRRLQRRAPKVTTPPERV
jgi:hypothetical protein